MPHEAAAAVGADQVAGAHDLCSDPRGDAFGILREAGQLPPELRLVRIGALLTGAEPALKGPTPKRPYTHLVSTIPARNLDDWFAPFLLSKSDH